MAPSAAKLSRKWPQKLIAGAPEQVRLESFSELVDPFRNRLRGASTTKAPIPGD